MAKADGRIEKGQRLATAISARAWNRAQDAADVVLGVRPGFEAGASSYPQSPYEWLYAKNTSGYRVDQFHAAVISGMEISPSDNLPQFNSMPVVRISANYPDLTSYWKPWCVAVEPIANNEIGRIAVAGVTQAKVNVLDESHRFVQFAADSASNLQTGDVGDGFILWKESGTGIKLCIIRLDAAQELAISEAQEDWPVHSSQTLPIKLAPANYSFVGNAVPNTTVSVYNGVASIRAGVSVVVARAANGWNLVSINLQHLNGRNGLQFLSNPSSLVGFKDGFLHLWPLTTC